MTEDEYTTALSGILRAWEAGDRQHSHEEIERVLRDGDASQRSFALFLRGTFWVSASDWSAAKADFIQSATTSEPGTNARHTAELMAGRACENLGEMNEAIEWYRTALVTCAEGQESFSGHSAAGHFLAATPELSATDEALAKEAVAKSWRAFELPGEPNLADLPGTIEVLRQHVRDLNEAAQNRSAESDGGPE